MIFRRQLAAVPRRLNPFVLPLTRHLPPFAVLHHKGRRSGRSFETPVQAYATPEGWLVGLTFDHNAPFALNLIAAGGGEMTRAGRRYRISQPRRVGREALKTLPALAALEMRAVGIDEFLQFDATPLTDRN
jgi:deazaflavin-dependent oxidoreductase (nitroreductase family)